MNKFIPYNLKPYVNRGREAAGWHPQVGAELPALPHGERKFWGIPFALGPAEGTSWLVLEAASPDVSLPLAGQASYLVFAHFCDASHDPTGTGQPADYEVGRGGRRG